MRTICAFIGELLGVGHLVIPLPAPRGGTRYRCLCGVMDWIA